MKLKERYEKEIVPALSKKLGIKNKMAVPRLTKIVINSGIGDAIKNKELLDKVSKDIATITGQHPSVRKAKLSVASFSVRQGMPIGIKVTLRSDKMYDFFQKLNSIVLPRLRDFRGVSLSSFDSNGNYNLGIADYSVFPEIYQSGSTGRGMQVTFVTSADNNEDAMELLKLMGVPFEKEEE